MRPNRDNANNIASISAINLQDLKRKIARSGIRPKLSPEVLLETLRKLTPDAEPLSKVSPEILETERALKPQIKRIHGAQVALAWFPGSMLFSPCRDRFGYMTPTAVRANSKMAFTAVNRALMNQLGQLMADPGREISPSSQIPAGYTYFGQFVDHDITLDVSSDINASTDATTLNNMRSPHLDLDSVYGRGPAIDPFLYDFSLVGGNPTIIKMQLGTNQNNGVGGPGGSVGFGGMTVRTNWDVPRATGSNTALIGDARNDENLVIAQFQHAMLRFHNAVIDLLIMGSFNGDYFAEAKKIVTHHYQWVVINDFLVRICGQAAVTSALANVNAPINSTFRMPVEFSVAAYRFGHSMIRDNYWVNFIFTNQPLSDLFTFVRPPNIPVRSNWIVDFNAFFTTGISVPVNNKARKIDSVLAAGLNSLPGFSGMMAQLASRNLRRGLALGLPSGQAVAQHFGLVPMTLAQLTSGLPANEVALISGSPDLSQKTPLWYYILREAMVLNQGESLGPVGGRIVAETFVRILKRDPDSYINASTPFAPQLPGIMNPGQFELADLLHFADVLGN